MNISVSFPGGKRVDAHLGDRTIQTDQSLAHGGDGSAPEPFETVAIRAVSHDDLGAGEVEGEECLEVLFDRHSTHRKEDRSLDAAVFAAQARTEPVEIDAATEARMVDLNCRVVVEHCHAFLPSMVARGRGVTYRKRQRAAEV